MRKNTTDFVREQGISLADIRQGDTLDSRNLREILKPLGSWLALIDDRAGRGPEAFDRALREQAARSAEYVQLVDRPYRRAEDIARLWRHLPPIDAGIRYLVVSTPFPCFAAWDDVAKLSGPVMAYMVAPYSVGGSRDAA